MPILRRAVLPIILLSSPLAAQDAAGENGLAEVAEPAASWDPALWDLADSEFAPEAAWRFGKLDNGLRYIIRRNDRPENTALVRMEIAAGSLDEREEELGFAHFVEHMAFNGSTNVPEGEMVKLLERLGLAFGADTNASTGMERTQYKLDLPRADPELLDTALMLMRETAGELTFDEEAVARERGVILAERRTRNTYALRNSIDSLEFFYPGSRAARRIPIGTEETLAAADAAGLRAFWEREYVPSDTVLVVVGDFDPDLVEAAITDHFADWQAASSPDQPSAGPVESADRGREAIYLDPALTEQVTIGRTGVWIDRPDTETNRRDTLLRAVGNRILGRRLQRLQRSEDPPFRGVSAATSNFFEAARSTQLMAASEEGRWPRAISTVIEEYRRMLEHGPTAGEIAEQTANLRTAFDNARANAATRSNAAFTAEAFRIARGESVPTGPAQDYALYERYESEITPAAVLAAMRADAIALDDPLIRFSGRVAPEGGLGAVRAAVDAALQKPVSAPAEGDVGQFAYTDFGPPGTIVEDERIADLGIRTLRFANGTMLNLKTTDLSDDRVMVRLTLDGGKLLESRAEPLAVELTPLLSAGGLGRHSRDELQSILAGRSVGASFGAGDEVFVSNATTTPGDLELQLQLMAAYLTDPGYRAEGLGPWKRSLDDFFAQLGRTPQSALSEGLGPILSDSDPRFTRQPIEAYRALDYEVLREAIADRLENGALEIAMVGDFDEEEAIRLVARTFGALPQREAQFRPYDQGQRQRSFTDRRETFTLTHGGEPDQALLRFYWPTADQSDWELSSRLTLLARVVDLALTETLREELGQTYAALSASSQSDAYTGYGTFGIGAEVDVAQIAEARAAMVATIERIIAEGPDEDTLERARRPLLEGLANRFKTNGGWMAFTARAQSEEDQRERMLMAPERQEAITAAELQALAARYLDPARAVVIEVLPDAPAS